MQLAEIRAALETVRLRKADAQGKVDRHAKRETELLAELASAREAMAAELALSEGVE